MALKIYTRVALVIVLIVVPVIVLIMMFTTKDLKDNKNLQIYLIFYMWVQVLMHVYNFGLLFTFVDVRVSDLWNIPWTLEGLTQTIKNMRDFDDEMDRIPNEMLTATEPLIENKEKNKELEALEKKKARMEKAEEDRRK